MGMYTLDFKNYRYLIRTDAKRVEVYLGGLQQKVLTRLPPEVKWENIEIVVKDPKASSTLVEKLFEMYPGTSKKVTA